MDSKLVKLINLCLGKNIPFVSYGLPGKKDIVTWIQLSGQFNYVEHIGEVADKEGFVYAPFHRRTNFPIAFFEPELIILNDGFEDGFLEDLTAKKILYPEYAVEIPVVISKQEYLIQANTFINSFDSDFTKAVLSRVKTIEKPAAFNAGQFFINMQKTYPQAFCHLINIPGAGVWTGVSPETLMRIDEQFAYTVSLAGTKAIPTDNPMINWTNKEISEQKIVTDYVEEVFSSFGISEFEKENIQNITAGNAVHLATKFKFNKNLLDNRLAEFLTAFHPTPAVCGYPKEKALDLIVETEKHNREYYSGYCGPLNIFKKSDLFVNLRCMKILKDEFALFVGGGLTRQSIAEKEWDETELKAQTLIKII